MFVPPVPLPTAVAKVKEKKLTVKLVISLGKVPLFEL